MGTLRFAVLGFAVLFTACAPVQSKSEFCKIASPIRPALGESKTLSKQLRDQIDLYDSQGAALCGWH